MCRKEPNAGRHFYTCSKGEDEGRCGFFEWAEPEVERVRLVHGNMYCACKDLVSVRRIVNGENRGRLFYCCPNDRCQHFEPVPPEACREAVSPMLARMNDLRAKLRVEDRKITQEDILAFVRLTKDQQDAIYRLEQRSPGWIEAHWLRISGSTAGAILGLNPHETPLAALRKMVWSPPFKTNAKMEYGSEMEDYLRQAFLFDFMGRQFERLQRRHGLQVDNMMHKRVCRPPIQALEEPMSFEALFNRIRQSRGQEDPDNPETPATQTTTATPAIPATREPQVTQTSPEPERRPDPGISWHPPRARVYEVGFLISTTAPYLGASPDGILEWVDAASGERNQAILEFKTRMGPHYRLDYGDTYKPGSDPCPRTIPAHYFIQVLMNMVLQRIKKAFFVVSNVEGMRTTYVEWTPAIQTYWERDVIPRLHAFYHNVFLPNMVKALNGDLPEGQVDEEPLRTHLGESEPWNVSIPR